MKLKSVFYFLANPHLIVPQWKFNKYLKENPEVPWITPEATKFLDENLKKTDIAFEWGSGRSTAWFAKRVQKITSIENNKAWFEIVKKKLSDNNITNIDYEFVEAELKGEKLDQIEALEKKIVPPYVDIINHKEGLFDFIVIDGSYRHICVKEAIPKLKHGGLLLIDNSNWTELKNWGVPKTWPIVHDSDIKVSRTTVWRKVG